MNCNDVERALSEESRLPLQAQEHARSCNRCQELVSALNVWVPVDPLSPATLRQIADKMAIGLRPVPMEPVRMPHRRPKDIPADYGMAEGAHQPGKEAGPEIQLKNWMLAER